MRMVRTLICIAALSSMPAGALSAHVLLDRAAFGVGLGIQPIDDSDSNSNSNRKSKLPCNSDHPPTYCKPKTGSS